MKVRAHIKIFFTALILATSATAQSDSYAKFDSNGDIIGLYGLSNKEGRCSVSQRLVGTVRSLKAEVQEPDIDFSFVFVSSSRRLFFGFSLRNDVVPRTDIEKLLLSNGKGKVVVLACMLSGRWTAKQITRQ